MLVLGELSAVEVVGQRIRKLYFELLERRFAIFLRVEPIKLTQRANDPIVAEMIGERQEIKVVACGTALEDQNALDPQHFSRRWQGDQHTVAVDLRGLQRLCTNQLPNAGLNSVEAAKNLNRALHSASFAPGYRLKLGEHVSKTRTKVAENVVGVNRDTMPCVHRCCSTPDKDSVSQDA